MAGMSRPGVLSAVLDEAGNAHIQYAYWPDAPAPVARGSGFTSWRISRSESEGMRGLPAARSFSKTATICSGSRSTTYTGSMFIDFPPGITPNDGMQALPSRTMICAVSNALSLGFTHQDANPPLASALTLAAPEIPQGPFFGLCVPRPAPLHLSRIGAGRLQPMKQRRRWHE